MRAILSFQEKAGLLAPMRKLPNLQVNAMDLNRMFNAIFSKENPWVWIWLVVSEEGSFQCNLLQISICQIQWEHNHNKAEAAAPQGRGTFLSQEEKDTLNNSMSTSVNTTNSGEEKRVESHKAKVKAVILEMPEEIDLSHSYVNVTAILTWIFPAEQSPKTNHWISPAQKLHSTLRGEIASCYLLWYFLVCNN